MPTLIKAMGGVLLCGALSLGCNNPTAAPGCELVEVVLGQCLTSSQCPPCTTVCEDRGGTVVTAQGCAQFIGSGFFCACTCEICYESDGGASED
jgi:uncharacterized lipoprotein NlpE involved in copper resistance